MSLRRSSRRPSGLGPSRRGRPRGRCACHGNGALCCSAFGQCRRSIRARVSNSIAPSTWPSVSTECRISDDSFVSFSRLKKRLGCFGAGALKAPRGPGAPRACTESLVRGLEIEPVRRHGVRLFAMASNRSVLFGLGLENGSDQVNDMHRTPASPTSGALTSSASATTRTSGSCRRVCHTGIHPGRDQQHPRWRDLHEPVQPPRPDACANHCWIVGALRRADHPRAWSKRVVGGSRRSWYRPPVAGCPHSRPGRGHRRRASAHRGGTPVTFDGEFYQVIELMPAAAPTPPIWVGVGGARGLLSPGETPPARIRHTPLTGEARWSLQHDRSSKKQPSRLDESRVTSASSTWRPGSSLGIRFRHHRPAMRKVAGWAAGSSSGSMNSPSPSTKVVRAGSTTWSRPAPVTTRRPCAAGRTKSRPRSAKHSPTADHRRSRHPHVG